MIELTLVLSIFALLAAMALFAWGTGKALEKIGDFEEKLDWIKAEKEKSWKKREKQRSESTGPEDRIKPETSEALTKGRTRSVPNPPPDLTPIERKRISTFHGEA